MTPFELISQVTGQYKAGQMGDEQFLAAVQQVEGFVQGFSAQLDGMQAPDAANEDLKRLGRSCIDLFLASLNQLREAVRTGNKALCDDALEKAGQGDVLVSEILVRTAS